MEDLTVLSLSGPLISDAHDKCIKSFKALVAIIEHPICDFGDQISPFDVRNEFDRYKVWAGNVGAMHRGKRHQISLDYRLSEAAFYRQQIQKVLEVLEGRRKPAEEEAVVVSNREKDLEDSLRNESDSSTEGSPWEMSDSEDLHDIAPQEVQKNLQAIAPGAQKPIKEIPYTLAEINFTITCLYKLPLRRPAPLDRFRGHTVADMSIYQHFDILYVRDKFPLANAALVTRLGKLVTRRRQLLASRSAHDQKLLSEDVETEKDALEAYVEPGKSGTPRTDEARNRTEAINETTHHSQSARSRRTEMTKASITYEEPRMEDAQKTSSLENFSEYAPSMASSYAVKLSVKVPDRPRNMNGEELQDFKCPYCFIVIHVESRDIWKRHVLRDLRPYVCTFQACELYELIFEKRDEWYQHEMESHRIEWKCGQTGHPGYIDQVAFLTHMSDDHNAAVGSAQSTVFLSMFEQPSHSQKGTCCLCLREARNLKTHLAHHLEQIALFSLPRESEVPEMDSGANMRGTVHTVSEKASSDSESEPPSQQDRASLQDSDKLGYPGEEDNDQKIDSIDEIPIPESDPGETSFSWTEVYQKIAIPKEEIDQSQIELLEIASKLHLRPGMERVRLNLTHSGRRIIARGDLQRMNSKKLDWIDCHAILFDHYFVLARLIKEPDTAGGLNSEKYDVSKVPIPMDLLSLESRDDESVVKSTMTGLGNLTAFESKDTTLISKAPTATEHWGHRQSTSNPKEAPGILSHTSTASLAASIQTDGSSRGMTSTGVDRVGSDKVLYPFRVRHLGRTEVYVLNAPTWEKRNEWCEKIIEAKTSFAASLHEQNIEPFRLRVLADTAFTNDNTTGSGKSILIKETPLHRAIQDVENIFKDSGTRLDPICRAAANCATAFNQPKGIPMIAVGTDDGVYISDYENPQVWSRAIAATRVTQIAVLEEFSLMLILSDQSLIAHHLDAVCPHSSSSPTLNKTSDISSYRAPQKLSGTKDVGFFAHGCMKNRQLVFYKQRNGIGSVFKVLEPINQENSQLSSRRFRVRKGKIDYFREFDEFYIATETHAINLFHSTLAIATTKGIDILWLDKKNSMSIPDLKPPECAAIAQRLSGQWPLGMFRLSDSEFLLVFKEVAIYVDKHGDVSRGVVMEFVTRAKQACLYQNTYLILVDGESHFVEIRNANNGKLRQVVSGCDMKLLDDASKGGTLKICMQHPERERNQVVLELIVNEGQKE